MEVDNFIYLISVFLVKAVYCTSMIMLQRKPGETVQLSCQNILGNERIQWLRIEGNKESITFSDGWIINGLLPFHERLRIVGDRAGETYMLEISNVTHQDSGSYICARKGTRETLYFNISLNVMEENVLNEDITTIPPSDVYSTAKTSDIFSTIIDEYETTASTLLDNINSTEKFSLDSTPSDIYIPVYIFPLAAALLVTAVGILIVYHLQTQKRIADQIVYYTKRRSSINHKRRPHTDELFIESTNDSNGRSDIQTI